MVWRILVTRILPENVIQRLCNNTKNQIEIIQWNSETTPVDRKFLLDNAANLNGVLCLLTDKIDAEFLLNVDRKKFKIISSMSVGLDHIDLSECKKLNIRVGYTPGVLTDATADLAMALLLSTLRRIPEGVESVKNGVWGSWKPFWLCGQGLSESVVGIVGLGRIGQAIAKRLQGFSVAKILYTGRSEKSEANILCCEYVSLDNLLAKSDVVIVSCPATPETVGMFDAVRFSQMKSTAAFINISRGNIVNQDDLYVALKNNIIWAAGLDVTTPEPLPVDSPLLLLPNCIVLPHIGSADIKTRCKMAELAVDNLLAALCDCDMPAEFK